MKAIALLLSTLALATALEWDDLVVTWRLITEDPEMLNSFFGTPCTRADAVSAGWVNAHVKQSRRVETWCLPKDPRFCVLLDECGIIAGVQVGILVSDAEAMQSVYSMGRIKYYQTKKMFNQQVWTSVAWTRNPATLKSRGHCGTWNNLTGTEGVWLEATDGYVEISRSLEDLDLTTWTEQACTPTMGQHYYNLDTTTACEDVPPWFLLYKEEILFGIGFRTFGTASVANRTWYDKTPSGSSKTAIPNANECVWDWSDTHGVVATHVWFTKDPWNFRCS